MFLELVMAAVISGWIGSGIVETGESVAPASNVESILHMANSRYVLYYEDPPDFVATESELDDLSVWDLVVFGPHVLRGNSDEPFFTGISDSLKARNSDIVLLVYTTGVVINDYAATYPVGSARRRAFDYLSTEDLLAREVGGTIILNAAQNEHLVNVMNPDTADTLARFYVDGLIQSDVDGQWAGFFVDVFDSTVFEYRCNDGFCLTYLDMDQDGTTFGSDSDEIDAYKAFQRRFLVAVRREFSLHGSTKRLIVSNGRYPVTNAQVGDLVDGYMVEGWNVFPPGITSNVGPVYGGQSTWETVFDGINNLTSSQVIPPITLFHSRVDSNNTFMNEVVALAQGGALAGTQDAGDIHGNSAIPTELRRLPYPGNSVPVVTWQTGATDTMTVTVDNYVARMALVRSYDDALAVWPYLVYAGTDTMSRGGGWPREDP